jgi:glutamate/aspartate transport system permease protein
LATGLRRVQVLRLIILPQALRAMMPLILNQIVIVFQDTSLVYVVSLHDFLTAASVVASRDGRATEMYALVAVVYLVICLGTTKAAEFYRKGLPS